MGWEGSGHFWVDGRRWEGKRWGGDEPITFFLLSNQTEWKNQKRSEGGGGAATVKKEPPSRAKEQKVLRKEKIKISHHPEPSRPDQHQHQHQIQQATAWATLPLRDKNRPFFTIYNTASHIHHLQNSPLKALPHNDKHIFDTGIKLMKNIKQI